MKQNTKFLWIYILILFSFALILIIFAGLSHNTEDEQKKGLKEDITELSQKNTELSSTLYQLQSQNDTLNLDLANVKAELETLKSNETVEDNNDMLLTQALNAHKSGDKKACKTALESLNGQMLNEFQQIIYDYLINEHKDN